MLTIIDDINITLQGKKTSLFCATKLLELLKSALGALRQNTFYESISESLSIASGLCIDTNLVADGARGEKFKDSKKLMEKYNL
jgi:hypothetical protein